VNGVILLAVERLRRRSEATVAVGAGGPPVLAPSDGPQLDTLQPGEAVGIGAAQILALFAGISRSGITMVAGLLRGLDHEDAARFSFLLATPIILAAGLYKIPDLMGTLGNGVRGQALVGGIFAALAAFVSVKFLLKYFETRTLTPFAIYCVVFGAAMVIRFA